MFQTIISLIDLEPHLFKIAGTCVQYTYKTFRLSVQTFRLMYIHTDRLTFKNRALPRTKSTRF